MAVQSLRQSTENPLDSLSCREREILGLFAKGMTNKSVAKQLFISEQTVKSHAKRIYCKMRVTSRVHAVLTYVENERLHGNQAGVTEPPDIEASPPSFTPKE
jgi:DNA-binding NarL/FixJ family response regulator